MRGTDLRYLRVMQAFARLLEDLVFTPGRNAKLAHLVAYFREVPDPDRGWAVAALTGDLSLPSLTPSRIRGLVEERVDPVLFRLSYDYVGDLAETVALIWPGARPGQAPGLVSRSKPACRACCAAPRHHQPRPGQCS